MSTINVHPDQLEETALMLRSRISHIRSALEAIEGEFRLLNSDVFAGRSADALRANVAAQRDRLMNMTIMLERLATRLEEAANAFRQADRAAVGTGSSTPGGQPPTRIAGNWIQTPLAAKVPVGYVSMNRLW